MYKDVPYRLYSLFSYEGIVREGIKHSKYGLYEFSILKKLTSFGISGHTTDIESLSESIFVPVPVSHQKLMKRGFNHAELIAQIIARSLKNTRVIDILNRCVDTPTQHDLDRAKRFENIKNAFSLKKNS
ncbi:ComF family protein, partial [candidate division WWE3 bacterium]|nr:ComF family protein [candidate division WWE3 bacterium]